MRPYNPIPFARSAKESISTGYRLCIVVMNRDEQENLEESEDFSFVGLCDGVLLGCYGAGGLKEDMVHGVGFVPGFGPVTV